MIFHVITQSFFAISMNFHVVTRSFCCISEFLGYISKYMFCFSFLPSSVSGCVAAARYCGVSPHATRMSSIAPV